MGVALALFGLFVVGALWRRNRRLQARLSEVRGQLLQVVSAIPTDVLRVDRLGALEDGAGLSIEDVLPEFGTELRMLIQRVAQTSAEQSVLAGDGNQLAVVCPLPRGRVAVLVYRRDGVEQDVAQACNRLASLVAEGPCQQSMTGLLTGVVHELNNPLSYVTANLDYLRTSLTPDALRSESDWTDLAGAVEDAREGALRVCAIVADLRALAACSQDGRTRSVEVHTLVERALTIWQRGASGFAIRRDYAAELQSDVHGARVVRALLKLLDGMASHDSAQLRCLMVSTRRVADKAVVHIHAHRSQGGSIDGDPRWRREAAAILSSCHAHLDIVADDRSFTVSIALPAPGNGSSVQPQRARKRMLVIDNDPMIGKWVQAGLAEVEVVAAPAGVEAIELLRSKDKFDLVLCDLGAAPEAGIESYEHARSLGFADRFVFLSNSVSQTKRLKGKSRASSAWLQKPLNFEKLQQLVAEGDRSMKDEPRCEMS